LGFSLWLAKPGAQLSHLAVDRTEIVEGEYAGASAQANVGVGLGANVLIGGLDKSIALQPVSVEGSTGLNVAAGIGQISLKHVR